MDKLEVIRKQIKELKLYKEFLENYLLLSHVNVEKKNKVKVKKR